MTHECKKDGILINLTRRSIKGGRSFQAEKSTK